MKRWLVAATVPLIALSIILPASGKGIPQNTFHVAAGNPAITASPTAGKPGQTITVSGTGFQPFGGQAVVRLTIGNTQLNGSGTPVKSDGTFSADVRVPDLTAAVYTIVAMGYAPKTTPSTPSAPATATATETPTGTPVATDTPTSTSTPSPTNTLVPTSTNTPTTTPTGTPTATPTSTPTTTATATSTPTNTPTATPTFLTHFVPTSTPTPTPTQTPTVVVIRFPTATPTPSPTPTPTCIRPPYCGGAPINPNSPVTGPYPQDIVQQQSSVSYHVYQHGLSAGPAPAGQLVFDGDRATFSFTIRAPSAPFTVVQSATCPSIPTVGVPATCTIIETVSNNGSHTLDFSHTVTNHLASGVRATASSSTVGATAVSGSTVVWNNFQLQPHTSASATIQVSFTPTAAQVGTQIVLSSGISASAVDTVTGQSFTVSYGSLTTPERVVGGARKPSAPVARGGAATSVTAPAASRLPTTGGARRDSGIGAPDAAHRPTPYPISP